MFTLSDPQPSDKVLLGWSGFGYGYHVHPLATRATVTIYNHEADLKALAGEGAPGEDGPWAALDIGAFAAETADYAVTVPHGTTHARLTPTAPARQAKAEGRDRPEPAGGGERQRKRGYPA